MRRKRLAFFNIPRQGYIRRIGEVIGELKQQDMDINIFRNLTKGKPKYADLALIYQIYQDFLKKNNLYDREDRYILCKRALAESEFLSNKETIYFNEFYAFTPIQQKILSALGEKAKITNRGLQPRVQEIKIVKAQNHRTEIMNLAHVITEDLEDGLLPEDMCIVLRNPNDYAHLLHEVFEEVGIPINLENQVSLIQNPFIKALQRIFLEELSDYFPKELTLMDLENQTMGEWATNLTTFLEDSGYPQVLCHIHGEDLSLIKRDLEAYEALINLLNELGEIDGFFTDETMDFKDFVELLGFYLQSRVYNYSIAKDGIWVLQPALLRGLQFKRVYTPGMVEGEFPRDFRPDWLLSEQDRKDLNEKGYEFDTLDILIEKEKLSFDFIKASSHSNYFSYPKVSKDNTSSLISSYLEELPQSAIDAVENVNFDSVYCPDCEKGVSTAPGVLSARTKRRLKWIFSKRAFSASAFNMYGECPYKFFLARVLKLSPLEEEGDYTALVKGTVLHKILELFFKNHSEGLESERLKEYMEEIKTLTDEVFESANVKESFLHPLLYELEKEEIAKSIINYVAWHMAQSGDFKPIRYETEFGYGENFYLDFAPDIRLSGKIDRIDQDSSGRLIIFDYKSSWTPDIKQVKEGTNLQMPLYIMASEKILKKPTVGGAFISIKKGSADNILTKERDLPFVSKRRRKGILSQKEWNDLMETVKTTIRQYADNIRAANFPLEPKAA